MQFRQLGRTELQIAPLVLGGNVFGWTADEATSFAILDAFVDAGFNAIDTADVYTRAAELGVGASETIIGRWLKLTGNRDRVILMTKVGGEMGEGRAGLSASYIAAAVEASLNRLQTDYIDLYQAHRDDPSTPQSETLLAFDELRRAGKIRAFGSSNYSVDRLTAALGVSHEAGVGRFETEQPLYNLYSRSQFESGLQSFALANQVSVIPYFGLASGFLTGKYRSEADLSQSPRGRLVKSYLNPRGLAILAALDEVACRHGAKPSQVALAWVMAQPSIAGPIASATSVQQWEEIAEAARLCLSAEDLSVLDVASKED